jgi:hypothetical protein
MPQHPPWRQPEHGQSVPPRPPIEEPEDDEDDEPEDDEPEDDEDEPDEF